MNDKKPERVIYLTPFGNIEERVLSYLKNSLEIKFGRHIEITKDAEVPYAAFNPLRNQFNASILLERLAERKTSEKDILLAISDIDLYCEGLNFIFGQADLYSRICVVSLYRLRPEFYISKSDKNIFLERTLKEAVHELGHILGLNHCKDLKCVMAFSNSLADTDTKESSFCDNCKNLIRWES